MDITKISYSKWINPPYKPDFDFRKLKINKIGKYSITRPYEAQQIINIMKYGILDIQHKLLKELVITDATCGVGGDTLHFSKYFKYVNSVDIKKENIEYTKHNLDLFGITNVSLYNDNYLNISRKLKQDIIYIDPPWGGVKYKEKKSIKLYLGNIPIKYVVRDLSMICDMIYIKVPLNADLKNINIHKRYTIYNKKNKPSFYIVLVESNTHLGTQPGL